MQAGISLFRSAVVYPAPAGTQERRTAVHSISLVFHNQNSLQIDLLPSLQEGDGDVDSFSCAMRFILSPKKDLFIPVFFLCLFKNVSPHKTTHVWLNINAVNTSYVKVIVGVF